MANGTKKDNFDPDVEFKASLDKIERPDLFAEVFCKAAESQVCIKEVLGKLIKEKITEDKEIHQVNKNLFKELIDEDKKFFIKTLFEKCKGFIQFFGGVLGTLFIQWLLKKFNLN